MLHYDPQHVSSSTLLILRRTNCITTASDIVTLCKQPYSMQVDSGLLGVLSRIFCYTRWLRYSCAILFWCSCIDVPVSLVLHCII